MLGRPPNIYWVACWTVIAPVLVLVRYSRRVRGD